MEPVVNPKEPKRRSRQWQKAFLAVFSKCGVYTLAADKAGVTRSGVFRAMARSEKFKAEVAEALEESTDWLEAAAVRRATDQKDPSDRLMMFLLSSRRPKEYQSNARLQIAGDPAAPIQVESKGTILILPAKEMDAAIVAHSPIPLLEEHNGEPDDNGGVNGNGSEVGPG